MRGCATTASTKYLMNSSDINFSSLILSSTPSSTCLLAQHTSLAEVSSENKRKNMKNAPKGKCLPELQNVPMHVRAQAAPELQLSGFLPTHEASQPAEISNF